MSRCQPRKCPTRWSLTWRSIGFEQVRSGGRSFRSGPGILTLNATELYAWADFRERAIELITVLDQAHPATKDVKLRTITLRYIDAIAFDPTQNVLGFLSDKLKTKIEFPASLFDKHSVRSAPATLILQAEFSCDKPAGVVAMKVGLGENKGAPAIVLDTAVESKGDALPNFPNGFADWLDAAHAVTSGWFKDLTAGELYASFEPA